jgi:hypothetical protein
MPIPIAVRLFVPPRLIAQLKVGLFLWLRIPVHTSKSTACCSGSRIFIGKSFSRITPDKNAPAMTNQSLEGSRVKVTNHLNEKLTI